MLLYSIRVFREVLVGYLTKIPTKLPFIVEKRCWPMDADIYMHMNNACFPRISELVRCRLEPNLLIDNLMKGYMLLIVENKITYMTPIPIMSKYIISTNVTIGENKWWHYQHTFKEFDDSNNNSNGKVAKIYAIVEAKGVLKERNGKTIKVSDVMQASNKWNNLLKTIEE